MFILAEGFCSFQFSEDDLRCEDPIHMRCMATDNQTALKKGNYFKDGRTKIGMQQQHQSPVDLNDKLLNYFYHLILGFRFCAGVGDPITPQAAREGEKQQDW